MRHLYALVFTCPVCRQRRRCLVFCRWVRWTRLDTAVLTLAGVGLFWVATYLVAGWYGVAVIAAVGFLAELVVLGLATRERPTYGPPYREEVVGELYPAPRADPWREVLDDPELMADIEAGQADVAAGRTRPWSEVRKRV